MESSNKYKTGQIYKIVDVGYNKCYIGSTIEYLSKRMTKHRADYKRYKNEMMNYVCSFQLFDEFGTENRKIELVENYPCNSKEELRAREGFHIKNTICVNKVVPNQTFEEYYTINKPHILDAASKYYQQNKDAVLTRLTQPATCDCGCSVMLCNLKRHLKTDKHKTIMENKM